MVVCSFHDGLRTILDTALDAVCVMDPAGTIIGWNDHAETVFGWTRAEAIGHRLSEMIIPPALRAAHERGLSHFLATGEGQVLRSRIEVPGLHREGHEVPVELSIVDSRQFGELLFIGFLRDISERTADIERQQRRLHESDHRIKNMLTVIGAIAHQTARSADDLPDFMSAFQSRLDGIARAHQMLVAGGQREVALSALAEQVLGSDVAEGRAQFGGPEVLLPPDKVMGLSMVLHELHTNAIKYGALCNEEGKLSLDWWADDHVAELVWRELGSPCDLQGQGSGFGQRMIAVTVKSDLKGTIERDWRPEGLTATIRFPIAA